MNSQSPAKALEKLVKRATMGGSATVEDAARATDDEAPYTGDLTIDDYKREIEELQKRLQSVTEAYSKLEEKYEALKKEIQTLKENLPVNLCMKCTCTCLNKKE